MLSKITLTPVHLTGSQAAEYQAAIQASQAAYSSHTLVTSPIMPTPTQASLVPPQTPIITSPPSNQVESATVPAGHISVYPSSTSSEYNLKIQALQALVMVLRSLVVWSRQGIAATIESTTPDNESFTRTPIDESPRAVTPNPISGSRSTSQNDSTNRAHLIDDPEQFEALKYRKKALQDAIQKFNFKPKKVKDLF